MRTFIATLIIASAQAGVVDYVRKVLGITEIDQAKFENLRAHFMAEKNDAFTPITIEVEGEKVTKYIASDGCMGKGADYICPEGKRGYIHNTPTLEVT